MKPASNFISVAVLALLLAAGHARAQNEELEKALDPEKPVQEIMTDSCIAKRKANEQDAQNDYCDCMGVGITVDPDISTDVKENLSYDFNFDTAVNPMMEEMELTDAQKKQFDALNAIEKKCRRYIKTEKY